MPPKKKLKRNLNGLRNQPSAPPGPPEHPSASRKELSPVSAAGEGASTEIVTTSGSPNEPVAASDSCADSDGQRASFRKSWNQDSTKPQWEEEDEEEDIGEEEGLDSEQGMDREGMQVVMMMIAADCGDDPRDEDWVPPRLRWRKAREYPKRTFEDAKKAAYESFDSCPVDVIRGFINRSWRFMSAYRIGLTGKAAGWAVRKQKGHRAVSQQAMMHLEAIVS